MSDAENAVRVIVVGSSAGGLDALKLLLGAARPGLGWCFVIAQHLSPDDPSAMVSLLSRSCALQVTEAMGGMTLRPDMVVVAPPAADIQINAPTSNVVTLSIVEPDEGRRPWPSIDRLFISAALALGEDAVAVVLSGTGEDGAAGVESIMAAGGVVAVQDQTSAAFGSMPGAAYATGSTDLQLPPQDIPAALENILADRSPHGHPAGDTSFGETAEGILDDIAVEAAIVALHSATGVDYSGYKRSTVRRQIERRQRIADQTPADYVLGLATDPAEATALSRSILVGVTAFFRDAPVWEALAGLLRGAVDQLPPTAQLRIWVPGCASGEEAYTIGMLAAEILGPNDLSRRLKIFATDLDERGLMSTRRARYSEAAVAAIPPALRDRWMRPIDTEWEISPTLRECLVIAQHNVAFDPPFPRLHLISLRNTMIYFQPNLQDRVLRLCQFALLPDGLLVLGKSEQVPQGNSLLSVANDGHRIYRRIDSAAPLPLPTGRYQPAMTTPHPTVSATRHYHVPAMYRRLLRTLGAPSLVLDEDDTLIEVVGDVSQWCALVEGRHSGHVTELLREPYRLVVRTMLSQIRQGHTSTVVRRVAAGADGFVEVSLQQVLADGIGAVISFQTPAMHPTADPLALIDPAPSPLTVELEAAHDALQATIDDLSSSNEELQALNEELQASTEELQASAEESQATNEELESANEELTTLNQQLEARGAELLGANTDLENIQASMTSGLVMVDSELRITRYSPLAVRVFSLIEEDIGRPLPAVPTTIPVPSLAVSLRETIATRATKLIELSDDARDFLLQIQPYTGSAGQVLGALVVVIDVTDVAQAQRERERALANLETVAESVRELVWQRDDSGRLIFLTKRVEDIYGLTRDRVLADPGLLAAAVHPADRDRVAAAMASTERRWQLEYRIIRPDGTIRWIDESAVYAAGTSDTVASITGSALDVTDRQRLQAAAAGRNAVLEALLSTDTVGVLVLDNDDRIVHASGSVAAIIGYAPEALIGSPLNVLLEKDPVAALRVSPTAPRALDAQRILGPDGSYRAVTIETVPVAGAESDGADATPTRVAILHDATRLREVSADLAEREQFDQQTGLLTRTYFRSRADALAAGGSTEFAVLWIDLDGFKAINDRFGHRRGDAVLATIAKRLQRAARRDDVIGRLGGDEFAMLITHAEDLTAVETLVHRVSTAVREPIDFDGVLAYVSASVGIAIHPQDGRTAEDLLDNADTAMYSAKSRGGDRHVYFAQDMNDLADERAELRRELAGAVRAGDFELHYQPVIEVSSGRLAHVEALLRWRRAGGLATADTFITHAMDSGQLRAIGRLVLRLLDADVTTLHSRLGDGQPAVSVNLSGVELEEREIADWLLSWSPAGGFERVIAEVTESVLLSPDGRAVHTLSVLRRLGATISVDDFGTGYSNLEALDRLQPEIIKMDQSMIQRAVETGGRASKILSASVQLAHALDAKVVIEGIADEPMWSYAEQLGAELAQGYFLAPPMPLEDLVDWIRTRPGPAPG